MSSALFEAIAAFREEIEPLEFDGVNPHFKSRFATLGNVIGTLKEALPKHGLTWDQKVVSTEGRMGVQTRVIHAESGESTKGVFLLPKSDNIQHICSSISYARRYGLVTAFGLTADVDDDGNSTGSMKRMAQEFERLTAGEDPDAVEKRLQDRYGVDDFRDLDYSIAELVLSKLRQKKGGADVDLRGSR